MHRIKPFADEFEENIKKELAWSKPIIVTEIGAVIGTHAGPGVLAAFYVKK